MSPGTHVDSERQTPRRRAALALALDAAFSGCEVWTLAEPRRRGEAAIPRASGPIALAQAEHALLDATPPQMPFGALRN